MTRRLSTLVAGIGLCVGLASPVSSHSRAQGAAVPAAQAGASAPTGLTKAQQEVIALSKDKWRWMSERNVEALASLFHDDAVLGVIKSGGIQYKTIDIQDVSVKVIGTTAILLNRIRLVALVGGNEVTNPFVVTEVYVQQGGTWKLGSLSFTRLQGS
jgi:hypothetical protein